MPTYLIIMMSRQGYNQMKTPSFNVENDRNFQNTPKFNKSMLKLCPPGSFKTSNTLKLVQGIQPLGVVYKYRAHKFKTQQNSPINKRTTSINTLRLPDLHLGSNTLSKREPLLKQNQGQIQRDVAKTAIIMDSLIRYLKDQCEPRNHFRQQKRVINLTEECNQFIELEKTKRSKKPKIVKNEITKKFFEADKERQRRIYSQDRSRKINNNSLVNQKLADYTFYGGTTLKIQAQGPISNKNELNEMRIMKMNRKKFDFQ